MDWIQFTLFVLAMLGMNMSLKADITTNRTEAAVDRRDMLNIIREIQSEMKDFHTKLALQDLEFKMRLCAIEERNRK